VRVENEKQSRTVCPSKRAVSMVVRTDSATWNCPTRSRIGVVPVVEGDTEKGDKTCASKKLSLQVFHVSHVLEDHVLTPQSLKLVASLNTDCHSRVSFRHLLKGTHFRCSKLATEASSLTILLACFCPMVSRCHHPWT
jgi:hypothetical protein